MFVAVRNALRNSFCTVDCAVLVGVRLWSAAIGFETLSLLTSDEKCKKNLHRPQGCTVLFSTRHFKKLFIFGRLLRLTRSLCLRGEFSLYRFSHRILKCWCWTACYVKQFLAVLSRYLFSVQFFICLTIVVRFCMLSVILADLLHMRLYSQELEGA